MKVGVPCVPAKVSGVEDRFVYINTPRDSKTARIVVITKVFLEIVLTLFLVRF